MYRIKTKKGFILVLIGVLINCENLYAINFFFGPKVALFGNDTKNPDSCFFKSSSQALMINKAKGSIYSFGIIGGITYKIPFLSLALQSEINYLYSYKLLSAWKKDSQNNKIYLDHNISLISLHYFSFPLFLKIALPLLRIYTGPRIRVIESIFEKQLKKGADFEETTSFYNNFFLDWCTRICIGLNKWGFEIGIGLEISKLLHNVELNKAYLFKKSTIYNWYSYMNFDIFQIVKINRGEV